MTHACHAICMLPPPDAALTMGFAKNTQHDMSKVSRLPRKMKMDRSKAPWKNDEKRKPSSEKDAKASRLSHRTTFDTL